MKRNAIKQLLNWKQDPDRKPLILKGARQVGKTWLMKEFAKTYYQNFVYFNFDTENELKSIFTHTKDPHRLIDLLAMIAGKEIRPEQTLIIFDEIQECPEALNSLKYFYESANEYHIMVAGSLLGTLLAQPKSYPVGMVNILHLTPLTFDEYLEAADASLFRYYSQIKTGQIIEDIFHTRLLEHYNHYLIIGGMPECVNVWLRHHDPVRVAKRQAELIELYESDISKYAQIVNAGRVLLVYRSLVAQLSKPNEKFMYGAVRESARARDFEEAIEWLVSAGLVMRVCNVSKVEHPLAAFDKLDAFKLFFFDTGLLKYMAGVDNAAILLQGQYQFKGPLTENYVLQQLWANKEAIRYYADNRGELDFLISNGTQIIPCEVKAGEDKSAPTFKRFITTTKCPHAVRFSKRSYRTDGVITNVPLYLAPRYELFLQPQKGLEYVV